MNSVPFGSIAKHIYSKWKHNQIGILEHQQKYMIFQLASTKNYIIHSILNDASEGAKFRRFFHNELDNTHSLKRTITNYEIQHMLDGEGFDVTYEKDSFVVSWVREELR